MKENSLTDREVASEPTFVIDDPTQNPNCKTQPDRL